MSIASPQNDEERRIAQISDDAYEMGWQEGREEQQAEVARLRAEVEEWKDETNYYHAEARKLRAALKEIADGCAEYGMAAHYQAIAEKALAEKRGKAPCFGLENYLSAGGADAVEKSTTIAKASAGTVNGADAQLGKIEGLPR